MLFASPKFFDLKSHQSKYKIIFKTHRHFLRAKQKNIPTITRYNIGAKEYSATSVQILSFRFMISTLLPPLCRSQLPKAKGLPL